MITLSSKPSILSPLDSDTAVIPVTLSWSPGETGKACNPVGDAALFVYMDPFNGKRASEPQNLVATLSVDASSWTVPLTYSVGRLF